MPNSALRRATDAVIAAETPTQFTIAAKLVSQTDEAWSYTPLFIDRYTINQDPGGAWVEGGTYADAMTISFALASKDYAAIYERAQGLMVVLTHRFADAYGARVYDPPPQVVKYRAMIVDPRDLKRQLRDVEQRTELDTQITLNLIEEQAYALRHKQFHGIFQNTTMEGLIRYIAQTFGIQTLHLAPPDNTHSYTHLVIPPAKGFDEVFDYLQATYGVYLKGLDFYFTAGALYVFPPYENAPKFPESAILYVGEQGDYAGAPAYHRTRDGVTEIVLAGVATSRDLSVMGAESHGTATMFMRSSQLVDGFVATSPAGVALTSDTAAALRLPGSRPMDPAAQHSKYTAATDNPFAQAAQLAKYQTVLLDAGWAQAVPGVLKPGHAVKLAYDDGGALQTIDGILEAAAYTMQRDQKTDINHLYSGMAKLRVRLTPRDAAPAAATQ